MICPQCHVEYRPGFTHCTDCDVNLVDVPATTQRDQGDWEKAAWQESTPIRKYDAQLWRGRDPHFYLSLIGTLTRNDVPCLGRAAKPPRQELSNRGDFESFERPELEVRVNQENLPFANRVLESTQEDYGKEWPVPDVEKEDKGIQVGPPVLVCPLCSAEFAEGDMVCSNCGVTLRTARETGSIENVPRLLSNLPHPRFFELLRTELRSAGIPFNNVNFFDQDRILGRQLVPSYEVLVLDSDFGRATDVLAGVLQNWEIEPSAGLGWLLKAPTVYQSNRAKENYWYPEDLDAAVWSGKNVNTLEIVGGTLREHGIAYRIEDDKVRGATVFVHGEEQDRAKEVVIEIVEGAPPE